MPNTDALSEFDSLLRTPLPPRAPRPAPEPGPVPEIRESIRYGLAVACPACRAEPGDRCRRSGEVMRGLHADRLSAARS